MPVSIRVGGVWKESTPWEKIGGVWEQMVDAPIKTGGAWKTGLLQSGPSVDFKTTGRANSRIGFACWSGARFYTSGVEYEVTPSNGSYSVGNWLTDGDAADVWIQHTQTSGQSAFDGRLNNTRYQVTANQTWYVYRSSVGTDTISGYFRAYDAASGGTLLDTSPTISFSAEYEFSGCPLCCFTPDTPVRMASGIDMPIGKVRAGDMIDTPTGPQEVGEVLIREQRAMYRIQFEDGCYLDASDDHPFEVPGKGPASINPQCEYKDLGIPLTLEVNDVVRSYYGITRITAIGKINYPGKVYTFSNSPFYANGILVY